MMTRATTGGTKHSWLVDDLAAVLADLRETANRILRHLSRYQETGDQAHLTTAALSTAELFQEIARISIVISEMRHLIETAKPTNRTIDIERLEAEVAALRADVERLTSDEARHD